jgi:hypothetical protein
MISVGSERLPPVISLATWLLSSGLSSWCLGPDSHAALSVSGLAEYNLGPGVQPGGDSSSRLSTGVGVSNERSKGKSSPTSNISVFLTVENCFPLPCAFSSRAFILWASSYSASYLRVSFRPCSAARLSSSLASCVAASCRSDRQKNKIRQNHQREQSHTLRTRRAEKHRNLPTVLPSDKCCARVCRTMVREGGDVVSWLR